MGSCRNLILLDCETSGLNEGPEACEIVQIYAKALNYYDFSDHHAGDFHAIIKPRRPDKAQAGAIKVLGPLWDRANKEGLEPEIVWKEFAKWCNSVNPEGKYTTAPLFVAYNKDFDSKFVRSAMLEYRIVKHGKFGPEFPWGFEMDAMMLAYSLLESDPNINDFKLNTVLNYFGLVRADAHVHDAKEDVELMTQLVRRMMLFMRAAKKKMKVQTPVPTAL